MPTQFDDEDEGWTEVDAEPKPPEEIVAEAKKKFSLSDKLKGITHSRDKVLVFTNMEAVKARNDASEKMTELEEDIARAEVKDKPALLERFNEAQDDFEAKNSEMLRTALAFHLRGVPKVVIDRCNREADQQYPPDTLSDPTVRKQREALYVRHLLCHVVEKVADADGDSWTLVKDDGKPDLELAGQVQNDLPAAQWARLDNAIGRLLWTDTLGQAATNDPGF